MQKILLILLLSACIISCSKDSGTSNNASSSSGTGGSLARFTIVGDYLYLAGFSNISVFDISNGAKPELKNIVSVQGNVETIFPYEDNLFLGSTNGMFIYSLSDPKNPKLLGTASHVRSCDPVVANDSIAFVTLRGGSFCGPATDGLYIHDIKDILKPELLKLVELPTPSGLGLNDSILYVCQLSNGMSVMNVKKPSEPVLIKKIDDAYFNDVIVYNDLLICYVNTGIRLYDITDAENPVYINLVSY